MVRQAFARENPPFLLIRLTICQTIFKRRASTLPTRAIELDQTATCVLMFTVLHQSFGTKLVGAVATRFFLTLDHKTAFCGVLVLQLLRRPALAAAEPAELDAWAVVEHAGSPLLARSAAMALVDTEPTSGHALAVGRRALFRPGGPIVNSYLAPPHPRPHHARHRPPYAPTRARPPCSRS